MPSLCSRMPNLLTEIQTLKNDNTWGEKGDLSAPGKILKVLPYQQSVKLIGESIEED